MELHIIKTWCEDTAEGHNYLKYNGYAPILRIGKYWVVGALGTPLADVIVII